MFWMAACWKGTWNRRTCHLVTVVIRRKAARRKQDGRLLAKKLGQRKMIDSGSAG